MKVLTAATLKGGNAKTTTCLALAAALAEKGHAVALLDADPQSTGTMIFGLKPVAEPWVAEPVELYLKELHAGSITLVRGGRPLRLANPKQRESFFRREDLDADVMIIDTAPGEIELVNTALQYADVVLIPVEPSPLSLTGMSDVAGLSKRLGPPPPIRTVLTRPQDLRVHARSCRARGAAAPRHPLPDHDPGGCAGRGRAGFRPPGHVLRAALPGVGGVRDLVEELYPLLVDSEKIDVEDALNPTTPIAAATHEA